MTNESIAAEMRECALRKNDEGYAGTYRLLNDAADLIEQQEAEIEQFKGDNIKLLGNWDTLCNKTQKYYADLYRDAVAAERADAIKEFAERLKSLAYNSNDWSHGEHPYVVEVGDIDDLVEEMMEERGKDE